MPVEGQTTEPVVAFGYPVRYGGTIPDDAYFGHDDDGMPAFNIKSTSQKDALALFEKSHTIQQNKQK